MKRRVLSILCVLSILMGMVVMPATAATTDSTEASTYNVGYAKVDLNPFIQCEATGGLGIPAQYTWKKDGVDVIEDYIDEATYVGEITIQTSETKTETVPFVKTPLGGYGNVSTRLADRMTDDNGDGIVGLGDGIFGTATSVTDSLGNTVIYITMDFLNGNATLSKAVRAEVVKKLGVDNISANRIMISGSHSHEAPAFGELYSSWNTNMNKADNVKKPTALGAYWLYLIDQLTNAAVTAYNNATPATMSKGSIEAPTAMAAMNYKYSDGTGYMLNFVRNYHVTNKRVTTTTYKRTKIFAWWGSWSQSGDPVVVDTPMDYYVGDNFGSASNSTVSTQATAEANDQSTYTVTKTEYTREHATEGNQTMNLLQFTPTNGAEPIVMVEWRAHASINGGSSYTNLSSDYVNALRYRLENNSSFEVDGQDYRVAFWQGSAGNNNNTSRISTEYKYNNDATTVEGNVGYTAITLDDDQDGVNDVRVLAKNGTLNEFYSTYYQEISDKSTTSDYADQFYRSALYGYILGKVAIYGLNNSMTQVTDYGEIRCIQNNYVTERQIWSEDYFLAAFEAIITNGYKSTSTSYTATNRVVLNSYYHANAILGDYTYSYDAETKELNEGYAPNTTPVTMELNAILMGSQVALVTGTGELFDYYDENSATTAAENDWLELTSQELLGNDSYGTPFTLSYTNNSTGYAPNTLAYDFPTNAEGTAFGSYEANTTDFAVGTGEKIIDQYAAMLTREKSLCAACNKEVDWSDLASNALSTHTVLTTGHYRLTGDTDAPAVGATNNYFTADGTICLDLNGYAFNSRGRSIILDGINDEVTTGRSILNLMDTSDNKTGAVVAHPSGNNVGGGVISANDGAILNLYGGTLKLSGEDGSVVCKGGIISGSGSSTQINLYGGCVDGSTCTLVADTTHSKFLVDGSKHIGTGEGCGAAIALNYAHLKVSGDAQVIAGTALPATEVTQYDGSVKTVTGYGDCVYVERGTASAVTLAGNAQVDDIYFAVHNTSALVLEDSFAGSVNLTLGFTPQQDMDVGNAATGATLTNVTCSNVGDPAWAIVRSGTDLLLNAYDESTLAVYVNADGEIDMDVQYDSLQAAVTKYPGTGYIKLIKDVPADETVTVSQEVYLDLNGCNVSANITANAPLYVMDSMTDDYNVNDSYGYGKLTGTLNGDGTIEGVPVDSYVATDGYLKVTETDETTDVPGVSFHRVNLQINKMVLRPRDEKQDPEGVYNPDVYYKIVDGFSADSVVADLVDSYGIAMRADDGDSTTSDKPSDNPLNDTNRSIYTGFKAGKGNNTGAGTLLTDVLKESNNILINRRNANIAVYGSAYIEIDGKYMFGGYQKQTLKSLVQGADLIWDGYTDENGNEHAPLSTQQKEGLVKLYETYSSIFSTWELTNIENGENGIKDAERQDLKILVVGNSHGLDATRLLYQVFNEQKVGDLYQTNDADNTAYDDVVIGALYYSGCTVQKHAEYMKGNTAAYTYHKNGSTDEVAELKAAASLDANQWWESNKHGKGLDGFTTDGYTTAQYALQDEQWDIVVMQTMNTDSARDARYSNSDFTSVINYINNNVLDSNGAKVMPKLAWHMVWTNPDGDEYLGGDESLSHPNNAAVWKTNLATYFPNADDNTVYDQSVMYQELVRCLKAYIKDADGTSFLGDKTFDYILPSAVAVEYAQDVLGCTQAQIYRDYTHMNDYGRLMVAYTWWAELMSYDSIGTNIIGTVPASVRHEKFQSQGDLTITDDMKRIITRSVNYALDMNDPSLDNAYQIEEDNTISILGIGNSYTIDSMWMLAEVYKAENEKKPENQKKTVELGIAYYDGCSLAQHVNFIDENSAVYTYYEWNSSTGTWNTTANMTLQDIIAKKNWEMVSMQQSSTLSGVASTYNSNIQTIQSTVESVLGYKPTYLWNMTWAYPVNDIEGDAFTTVNTTNGFTTNYGSSQATMYKKIVETVQAKIVPDATFEYLMPVGTAIQNANATLDDPDLYRDYTHLNDFSRVIAAYVWYSELETVTLDEIKLTAIPEALTKSYVTAGGSGDMTLTEDQISLIAACVKNAMQDNFTTTDTSVYAN